MDEEEEKEELQQPAAGTATCHDSNRIAPSMFPGFRFSPTDDELISYYLTNKLAGSQQSVRVIPEIEIWKYEPWELPGKSVFPSETEWFFFSPRGRKYPNGSQSRRATELGYWKATGKERSVKSSSNSLPIGTKRTLVFHLGRAPKGERTEWIMHEYCVLPSLSPQHDSMVVCRLRKNADFRLDQPRDSANTSNTRSPSYDDSVSLDTEAPPMPTPTPQLQPPSSTHVKDSIVDHDDFFADILKEPMPTPTPTPQAQLQPPSSTHIKDSVDDHDDFFADILKDDIVKLDQALDFPSASSSGSTSSSSKPAQGTANRRIRLLTRTNPVTITPTPSAPPRLLLALVLLLLTIFLLFLCFYAATVLLC